MPPTERRGRVHTSTVTVAVLLPSRHGPGPRHPVGGAEFRIEWYSGSGAGGQHRNKHQNSCRVIHEPTGIMRKAETRSRESSLREAMDAVSKALHEIAERKMLAQANKDRREQVGSGMRGDKRRTYRFQDDSVTDHVTGKTARCSDVMRGRMELLWPK